MNLMVRFKRACAVLAAGATLAGGLALLPTVAQAAQKDESNNAADEVPTCSLGEQPAPFWIDFIGNVDDFEGKNAVAHEKTNNDGLLSRAQIEDAAKKLQGNAPQPVDKTIPDQVSDQIHWQIDGWSIGDAGGKLISSDDLAKYQFKDPGEPGSDPTDDNPNSYFTRCSFTKVWPHWARESVLTFTSVDPLDENMSTTKYMVTKDHKAVEQPFTPANYPGYVFEGWFTPNIGKDNKPVDEAFNMDKSYGDTTFTARWKKVAAPAQPSKPAQTTPAAASTVPTKDPGKKAAKDAKDAQGGTALARTGTDALAPLSIAAGLCLAAGITLGLRRKLAL